MAEGSTNHDASKVFAGGEDDGRDLRPIAPLSQKCQRQGLQEDAREETTEEARERR